MFRAHIFKQRQVGDREEVKIQLFNSDGSPFGDVEPPNLSLAVREAWKGDYSDVVEYSEGSLVRHDGSTYLALADVSLADLAPGEEASIPAITVKQDNTDRNGWNLPRDMVAVLANLAGGGGYFTGGDARWFRISGAPGEAVTLSAVGAAANTLHLYGADGNPAWQGGNTSFPKTVIVPGDGWFGIEVGESVTSIKYVGPTGPQPLPGNPWTLFA